MFFYFLRVIQSFCKIVLRFSWHNSDSFCITFSLSLILKVMLGNFLIFFPYIMRAGCFVRFCTDTLDNDLMVLRLQKNYMLLPSAIVRLSGGSVGVYFSISWEWFNFDYLLLLGRPGTHTYTHTHTHTHTHTRTRAHSHTNKACYFLLEAICIFLGHFCIFLSKSWRTQNFPGILNITYSYLSDGH